MRVVLWAKVNRFEIENIRFYECGGVYVASAIICWRSHKLGMDDSANKTYLFQWLRDLDGKSMRKIRLFFKKK